MGQDTSLSPGVKTVVLFTGQWISYWFPYGIDDGMIALKELRKKSVLRMSFLLRKSCSPQTAINLNQHTGLCIAGIIRGTKSTGTNPEFKGNPLHLAPENSWQS